MNIRNLSNPVLYTLSTVLVVAAAFLLKPGTAFLSIYWPLAFWTLVALDFYRSQVVENGATETDPKRYSFADRFIGYIFAAPFILPARALRLIPARG